MAAAGGNPADGDRQQSARLAGWCAGGVSEFFDNNHRFYRVRLFAGVVLICPDYAKCSACGRPYQGVRRLCFRAVHGSPSDTPVCQSGVVVPHAAADRHVRRRAGDRHRNLAERRVEQQGPRQGTVSLHAAVLFRRGDRVSGTDD